MSTERDEDRLLPCPFCGGPGSFYPDGEWEGHSVRCWNLDCEMSKFGHTTEAEAAASWNRRSTATTSSGDGKGE